MSPSEKMLSGLTLSPNLSDMTVCGRSIPRDALIRAAYLLAGIKIGALWLKKADPAELDHTDAAVAGV